MGKGKRLLRRSTRGRFVYGQLSPYDFRKVFGWKKQGRFVWYLGRKEK